jgi:hypothetical protein
MATCTDPATRAASIAACGATIAFAAVTFASINPAAIAACISTVAFAAVNPATISRLTAIAGVARSRTAFATGSSALACGWSASFTPIAARFSGPVTSRATMGLTAAVRLTAAMALAAVALVLRFRLVLIGSQCRNRH